MTFMVARREDGHAESGVGRLLAGTTQPNVGMTFHLEKRVGGRPPHPETAEPDCWVSTKTVPPPTELNVVRDNQIGKERDREYWYQASA